jgi:flagellar protein FliO/FliZ
VGTESLVSVGVFLVVLACLPMGLKWFRQRYVGGSAEVSGQSRFISALAVGPHQRVVTVEVGPQGRRVWLTLGVTAQSVSCLHCIDVTTPGGAPSGSLGEDGRELH